MFPGYFPGTSGCSRNLPAKQDMCWRLGQEGLVLRILRFDEDLRPILGSTSVNNWGPGHSLSLSFFFFFFASVKWVQQSGVQAPYRMIA